MSLSGSIDLFDVLITLGVGIHVLPESFSVEWIVSSSIELLTTIIEEWNTSGSQCKSEGRLESLVVMEEILESGIVVVIHEDTKCINIFELSIFFRKSVFDVVHTLS